MTPDSELPTSLWQIGLSCSAVFAGVQFILKFLFNRGVDNHDKKIKEIDDHLEATDKTVEEMKNKHADFQLNLTKYLGDMKLELMQAINNK